MYKLHGFAARSGDSVIAFTKDREGKFFHCEKGKILAFEGLDDPYTSTVNSKGVVFALYECI